MADIKDTREQEEGGANTSLEGLEGAIDQVRNDLTEYLSHLKPEIKQEYTLLIDYYLREYKDRLVGRGKGGEELNYYLDACFEHVKFSILKVKKMVFIAFTEHDVEIEKGLYEVSDHIIEDYNLKYIRDDRTVELYGTKHWNTKNLKQKPYSTLAVIERKVKDSLIEKGLKENNDDMSKQETSRSGSPVTYEEVTPLSSRGEQRYTMDNSDLPAAMMNTFNKLTTPVIKKSPGTSTNIINTDNNIGVGAGRKPRTKPNR